MSGFAGQYVFRGGAADERVVGRMMARLSHRGPDGSGLWASGPVALGHLMLCTTPESLRERQPLLDTTGRLCLTLDGRIDNRDELKAALQDEGVRLRDDTDAELVLQAYGAWGEHCAARMLGDFALAIWDAPRQRLFCARDVFGLRPFYYYCDNRVFLCASELQALLAGPPVSCHPNEGLIAEYLACAVVDQEETLIRSVRRLPPAHVLIIEADHVTRRRYWDANPTREIRYPDDQDYADHFTGLLREAVRCRLRSASPVASELSGGLDSSSIVATVMAMDRDDAPCQGDFETFSLIFPGRSCDERTYIEAVARFWNITATLLPPEPARASYYQAMAQRDQDLPPFPNSALWDGLATRACAQGFRVRFGGAGGDEWFTGSFYHYADYLRNMQVPTLIRQLRTDSRVSGVIFPLWPLLSVGFWPLLPHGVRTTIKHWLGRDRLPAWIDPQFAARTDLADRLREPPPGLQFPSLAQQYLYRGGTSGWGVQGNEMGERHASYQGYEGRYPLLDRRLVDFALAIPESQRWREDQTKFVLREAMRGLLPESVRTRRDKADFSYVFADTLLSPEVGARFDRLRLEGTGWIDPVPLRRMYEGMAAAYRQGDASYTTLVWPLWMVYAVDLWLEALSDPRRDRDESTSSVLQPRHVSRREAQGGHIYA